MEQQKPKPRNAAKDLVCGALIALFGLYVLITSLNMKVYRTFFDGPGFFPAIVGTVMLLLGVILAVIGFKLGGMRQLGEVLNAKFLKEFVTSDSTVRILILIAMMAVYIYVLLGRVHFIIATSVYLIANFLYLKALKQWWVGVIVAVAVSFAVYYAFRLGFGITMP